VKRGSGEMENGRQGENVMSRMRHILIIMAFSMGVFLPSITGGFLWDDEFLIVHNPRIKSLKNIPSAFKSEFFQDSFETEQITFYRPAVTIFNTMQYAIFGLRPFWWRLTNLLLHAVNAAFVYLLLTRVLRLRENAVFFVVLLYAVHPALSESVCFVSGRTDLLAMLCILLSLLFYFQDRGKNPVRRFLSIAFFTIGLFTKEIVLVLPVAIAAMDYITSEQSTPREWVRERSHNLLYSLLPFFIIGTIYLIVRFFFVKGITVPSYPSGNAITTWLTMPCVFTAYILSVIFPISLSCDNTNAFSIITSPFDPWFLICFGITAVIIAIMVWQFFKKSRYFIGLFWFLLFLAPVMNIFPLGIWMADRFMYIPLVGIAIIFAVVDIEKILWKKLGFAFWGFFLLYFIILSLYWSRVWRDDLTLWSNAVYQRPANPQARVIYAQALFSRGKITEAEKELAKADTSKSLSLAIAKEQTLVKIYVAQKQFYNATAALRRAEALLPNSAVNAMLEGRLHQSQGRMDDAERDFRKSLDINPALLGSAVGLMEVLSGRKDSSEELLHAAERAIAINPDFAPSYVYKGMALRKIGKDDEAMDAFKNAIRLSPEAPEAYLFLADMYETRAAKDPDSLKNAIATYQKLLTRHPDNIDAMNNLAIIYAQKGEKERARELWNRLLAIRPDDPEAKANLQRMNGGSK